MDPVRVQAIEDEEVNELGKRVNPPTAIKDELFDDVLTLNFLLKKIPDEFCQNAIEIKGTKIFNENHFFPLLYKLVSIVFSLSLNGCFLLCCLNELMKETNFIKRQSNSCCK